MTTATFTEAPTVKLMARYEKFRLQLEPPEEVVDPRHGKYRVPGTGKTIKFNNYRAEIPAELLEAVENHPQRPMQRGVVGLAEAWTSLAPSAGGPQIVTGALATAVARSNQEPMPGWDGATGRDIIDWIEGGQVPDLDAAEVYEKAHQRRKMVIRALVDAQLDEGDPKDSDPPPAASSDGL